MSIPFSFELMLALWAAGMIGLIWWSSADARSLPDSASRGELYASRLNGTDFWTHVTVSDLARTALHAEGHPVTPEAASTRVLEHLQRMYGSGSYAGNPGSEAETFRILHAKSCHLSGYSYVLVTACPTGPGAALTDVVRCVVYADGEIGALTPQQQVVLPMAAQAQA